MARIVDDLLSLSRIEMNEHRPPEGVAELGNVIGSIVESARMLADERGVRIDVQQKEPVTVPGMLSNCHGFSRIWSTMR